MRIIKNYIVFFLIIFCMTLGLGMTNKAEAADLYTALNYTVSQYVPDPATSDWITRAIMYSSSYYNVDPILICSVMEAESQFNFNALSSVGAVGLMQLMPETASSIGVNPYDPLSNILGGAAHLRDLLNTFLSWGKYGVTYAIAAYNAGSNAVLNYGGVPPYSETQDYVRAVADNYNSIYSMLG